MKDRRVSIVVPTCAGIDAGETLASIEAQDYPGIEVVVESTERLHDALDAGFARARGDVLAFLRPGERLLPGAVRDAAAALDGERAVMGRCAVIVPGAEVPVELPSEYRGLFDHLAVWKSLWDRAARPALFWTREAHAGLGPFADAPPYAVDYGLVCALGRARIRPVDRLWSVCPMPDDAIEIEQLRVLVGISRAHWGSWLAPLRWRCEASYALHSWHWHDRARHHARRAEIAAAGGHAMRARIERCKTAIYSPAMARERFGVAYRRLLDRKSR
jgi:hypothetical protein